MNGIWDLPDVKSANKALRVIGAIVNDWQLSGILTADSGSPYDVSYSYNNGTTGQALTGSPDYTARVVVNNLGALGSGCSSDQYAQFNNTMVAVDTRLRLGGHDAGAVGSAGREPRPRVRPEPAPRLQEPHHGPGDSAHHPARREPVDPVPCGPLQRVQLRDLQRAGQTRSSSTAPTDMSVRNSQFLADGTSDPNRVRPNQAGFGAVNGARALQTVQGKFRSTSRTRLRSDIHTRPGGHGPPGLFLSL